MASFIVAYVYSVVLDDDTVFTARNLVDDIDLTRLEFDPDTMRDVASTLNKTRDAKLAKMGAEFISQFRRKGERAV